MRPAAASWAPVVLAVLVALAASPVRADEALDRAWAERDRPGGLDRAIAAYDQASRREDAGREVFERLVRMRFYRSKECMAEKTPEHRDETRRCVADGVRGLAILDRSAGRAGFRDAEEVGDALDRLGPESVGILFWTALCYGNSIRYSPLLKQPSGAKRFRRMVERSLALDERYFFAGPHRVLAGFFHEAPGIMGGDDDAARRHAEAAVRLFPQYAENPICRAENVWKPDGDDDRFRDDVRSALAVPEDACPDARPEQRAAQAYARRLGN